MSSISRIPAAIAVLLLSSLSAPAQDPLPAQPPSTNLAFKAISPGVLGLGLVRLDQKSRTVTIPAFVNLREGVLEYLLVTSNGKTHESLLRTDAEPQHIHVAMLLLGAIGAGTNALPVDPTQPLPGDKVTIEVVWKNKSREIRVRAESLVRYRKKNSTLSKGDWSYTGSRLREDGFAAQADGSIVSLITDPDSLVNNPRPGREDDDSWLSKPGSLPKFNEPVQVVISIPSSRDAKGEKIHDP